MPQRVAVLIGQRVKLVIARDFSSCAVTEKGELFTWGQGNEGTLGQHEGPRGTPMRVDGLRGVKVAAVASGWKHTLAADVGGVVCVGLRSMRGPRRWCFGPRGQCCCPNAHSDPHAARARS
jgi:alpha-tubulin suppressor-like RCC1 family protein